MTSLEFIKKEIDVTKKQLAKYPLSKEQCDPNYKHKEADIQYIHNKYYTEQLQTLQQIKTVLEAWEIVKKDFTLTWEEPNNASGYYLNYFGDCEYEKIKKALEVKDE